MTWNIDARHATTSPICFALLEPGRDPPKIFTSIYPQKNDQSALEKELKVEEVLSAWTRKQRMELDYYFFEMNEHAKQYREQLLWALAGKYRPSTLGPALYNEARIISDEACYQMCSHVGALRSIDEKVYVDHRPNR